MVVEPTVWHAPLINYADKTPLINMAMDSFQSRLNLLFTWHTSRDMKSVVFAVIKLLPAPEQQSQVIEILRWVGDLTRPEPGCLGCWLSEEGPFCDEIQYVEQWDLDETMHEHIRSDLYARVLAAMVSRQSPEVGFHYVTEEKGIELIETLSTADVPKVEHSFSQGVAP
jgi:quinol monooxygenase YgiN